MLLSTVQQIVLHLKYAYESLHESEKRARSSSKAKLSTDLIYSKSEAQNVAELSAKLIKSMITDSEVTIFIIMECPELTVSVIQSCAASLHA